MIISWVMIQAALEYFTKVNVWLLAMNSLRISYNV